MALEILLRRVERFHGTIGPFHRLVTTSRETAAQSV